MLMHSSTFAVYKRRESNEAWQLVSDWDDELMACSHARAHLNIDHSRGLPDVEALVIKVEAPGKMPETLESNFAGNYVLCTRDGTHDEKFIAMMKVIDRELERKAHAVAQLIDLATIGAWLMDARSRDYSVWSDVMREDSTVSIALSNSDDEAQFLETIYYWSYALLAGGYLYKEGMRDYEKWSRSLLSVLDEELREEISPHLREFFRLAEEMVSDIGKAGTN